MSEGPWPLPAGWRWVRLGEVASIIIGRTPRKSEYEGAVTGNKILKFRDILVTGEIDWSNDKGSYVGNDFKGVQVCECDVVVTSAAHSPEQIGRKVALVQRIPPHVARVLISAEVLAVRPTGHKLDSGWLYWWLRSDRGYREIQNAVKEKHLTKGRAQWIRLLLPPLSEQRRIVARIEELMERLREARRLREQARADAERLWQSVLADTFPRPGDALPGGWRWVRLGEACAINPRRPRLALPEDATVTFVPMKAIDDTTGTIRAPETRSFAEVRSGYTYFQQGDVLFAKITPCMENGKIAIARELLNGIGFGTTEFHVLRPREGVTAEWVWLFLRRKEFREEARRAMTGAVGHQRVPPQFLEEHPIPLPPLDEQKHIVAHLDAVQERVRELRAAQDRTAEALETLERSILDRAFRGEL